MDFVRRPATGLKLNLGAGRWRPAGYTHVDLADAEACLDLSVTPWRFESETADEILLSHVLEHFDKSQGRDLLYECHRVLAPGGLLRAAVPDLDLFIECRNAGDWSRLGGYRWTDFNHFLGGDETETTPGWRHRYMYTFESLHYALEESGFRLVRRRGPGPADNPEHAAYSLYVDAIK